VYEKIKRERHPYYGRANRSLDQVVQSIGLCR
jgi:hypothetical protein